MISIHVPREGHDIAPCALVAKATDFNPRAPRGARPLRFAFQMQRFMISIHVPREGHDCTFPPTKSLWFPFQSTCPARGTTPPAAKAEAGYFISIHVPREGHDYDINHSWLCLQSNFNPRAPRGARPLRSPSDTALPLFQSTCPARGTTVSMLPFSGQANFNPRAPRGARPLLPVKSPP